MKSITVSIKSCMRKADYHNIICHGNVAQTWPKGIPKIVKEDLKAYINVLDDGDEYKKKTGNKAVLLQRVIDSIEVGAVAKYS